MSRAIALNQHTAFPERLPRPSASAFTLPSAPAGIYAPPTPAPARGLPLLPLYTHLRWSREWMLREDLPWPPPTQLRERPNSSAVPASRSPYGLMPERPTGRAPVAAAQAEEAAARVLETPPTTFLPGPQPRTDIQPEPAVRPPRFTASRREVCWEMQFAREAPQTGLCEGTTKLDVHQETAALEKRRGERRGVSSGIGVGGALRNVPVKMGEGKLPWY